MLGGKTFISTRPAGRSEKLQEFFSEQGATLIEMPMIDIRKAQLSLREIELVSHSDQFGWLVFTSTNGVIHFFDHLKDITGSIKLSGKTRIAVIGSETGSELKKFGHVAHFISKGSTGRTFSDELRKLLKKKPHKVLLPTGNLAPDTIEKRLEDVARVSRINVYNTEMPDIINYEALKRIEEDDYEMVIFTSNSGFNNFYLTAKDKINMNSLRVACIGSTTAGAVAETGVKPLVTARKMNSQGIAEAILDYYK